MGTKAAATALSPLTRSKDMTSNRESNLRPISYKLYTDHPRRIGGRAFGLLLAAVLFALALPLFVLPEASAPPHRGRVDTVSHRDGVSTPGMVITRTNQEAKRALRHGGRQAQPRR